MMRTTMAVSIRPHASGWRAGPKKREFFFVPMLYVRDPAGKLANILAHSPAEDG
jgi:hypothetical protein